MNSVIRNGVCRILKHLSRNRSSSSKSWQYEELTGRSFLKASGRDSKDLLQGLTTNDLNCLDHNCAIYSFMLNVKGRVLYDVFIYKVTEGEEADASTYLIECDATIAQDLFKHFKMYKLRKKVQLSDESSSYRLIALLPGVEPEVPSTDACRPSLGASVCGERVCLVADPRIKCWSARLVLKPGIDASEAVEGSVAASPGTYSSIRHGLGIAEGVSDFPVGASLPMESNGDLLNAISFDKGCYLGQELTARTFHTGVTRKRLMPLKLTSGVDECAPNSLILSQEGQTVGRLRSLVGGSGLGLLRLSALSSPHLRIKCSESGQEVPAVTHVPSWWPSEIGLKLEKED